MRTSDVMRETVEAILQRAHQRSEANVEIDVWVERLSNPISRSILSDAAMLLARDPLLLEPAAFAWAKVADALASPYLNEPSDEAPVLSVHSDEGKSHG